MRKLLPALPVRLLLALTLSLSTLVVAQAQVPVYGYRVVNSYPHDATAFTQGLVFRDGHLYESTGRNGDSRLFKRTLESTEPLLSVSLANRYFGEGVEIVNDRIFQLTWQSHMVFVYNKSDFAQVATHYNPTEGWGLAFDGQQLILSDGTDTLQFVDPETFAMQRRVKVTLDGRPLRQLNELEFIDGEVWANVWQTDFIVRIDPVSGQVQSIINLQGLSGLTTLQGGGAVLNGIAWDADSQRLFVTGKLWAHLFEIELVDPGA